MITTETFVSTVVAAYETAGSYEMRLLLGRDGALGELSGSVHLGEVRTFDLTMTVLSTRMRLRAVDGTRYMSVAGLGHGRFLAVDPDDPDDPFAPTFTSMASQADPTMGLAEHAAAVVAVTPVGEPTQVDGVGARTYEVLVDPRRMPQRMAALEAMMPPGQEVPATIAYTCVVDADGLLREMSYELLQAGCRVTVANPGAAAPVVAPGPDEITTRDALVG